MDYEVQLNYRLTAHLEDGEHVLATLVSPQHGIYAATDRRVLCLNNASIGYRLRMHPYSELERVACFSEDAAWFVQFLSGDRQLTIRSRSEKEAKDFASAVASRVAAPEEQTS